MDEVHMNNMVCKRNMVNEFMSGKSFVMYICLFFTKGVKNQHQCIVV